MAEKEWRSCAEWGPEHGFRDNMTEDLHDTEEGAQASCSGLEREGLGGEKIHLPLRTWTEKCRVDGAIIEGTILDEVNLRLLYLGPAPDHPDLGYRMQQIQGKILALAQEEIRKSRGMGRVKVRLS